MTLQLHIPAEAPSPLDNDGWAICYGKQTFHTAAAARHCIDRRKRRLTGQVKPYRCTECGKWHIGHTQRRTAKRTRTHS